MPRDEPMGANPPGGAFIDYRLSQAPKAPIEITIANDKGEVVRRYSSGDSLPPLDLGKIDTAPEWIVRPAPPAATPGLHRIVWDFHYFVTNRPGRPAGFRRRLGAAWPIFRDANC